MYDAPPLSHFESVEVPQDVRAQLKERAFRCMEEVHGFCSEQKGAILIDLVLTSRPKKIVEIGVWGGKSLLPMACALQMLGQGTIYGIDPWDQQASLEGAADFSNIAYWTQIDHQGVFRRLFDVMQRYELQDYIEVICATSAEAQPIDEIDVLHIDGNHSDATSYFDVIKWVPLVKKGGWVVFDDMTWYENGVHTTRRAVDYLDAHCHRLGEITELCVWGIWYKP